MFDHPDDDIYDGILTENDEEVPRIKIEFIVQDAETNVVKRDRSSDITTK